jgi:hypothetical protein
VDFCAYPNAFYPIIETFYLTEWNRFCMITNEIEYVQNTHQIRKDVPIPQDRSTRTGLSATIRRMEYGDSTVIPGDQQMSVHTCARSVGARVKTRSNKDGTVTVWRIDEPIVIDRNIFGDSMPKTESEAEPAEDIFK